MHVVVGEGVSRHGRVLLVSARDYSSKFEKYSSISSLCLSSVSYSFTIGVLLTGLKIFWENSADMPAYPMVKPNQG